MISYEWVLGQLAFLESWCDQGINMSGPNEYNPYEIKMSTQNAYKLILAFRELLRLRTLVPLAERVCADTENYRRSALHLEMEIEKYKKDFQSE